MAQLHEEVIPWHLGISEKYVYVAEALMFLAFLLLNRRVLLRRHLQLGGGGGNAPRRRCPAPRRGLRATPPSPQCAASAPRGVTGAPFARSVPVMMGTATFTRVVNTSAPTPKTPMATIHSTAEGRYS